MEDRLRFTQFARERTGIVLRCYSEGAVVFKPPTAL